MGPCRFCQPRGSILWPIPKGSGGTSPYGLRAVDEAHPARTSGIRWAALIRRHRSCAINSSLKAMSKPFWREPAPFVTCWRRRFGVNVPPPLFIPFGRLAIVLGAGFAVLYPAVKWLLRGGQFRDPLPVEAATALLGGVLFGISMAGYNRYRARKLRLPTWEQYPGPSQLS